VDDRLTESEIVRGLQSGCSDAWAALCDVYSARVWRYVARLVGADRAAVADVFQETMLAVARAGRSLKDDPRVWAWLSTIAHNQAALFWRKHYRDAERNVGDDVGSLVAVDDPAESLLLREQSSLVRRLLAEMAAQDASVLVAKYMDGLSVQQIVELHGGTVEGVRSRLARAKREFRERFEMISDADRSISKATDEHGI